MMGLVALVMFIVGVIFLGDDYMRAVDLTYYLQPYGYTEQGHLTHLELPPDMAGMGSAAYADNAEYFAKQMLERLDGCVIVRVQRAGRVIREYKR
jgi:hypothetical protein